MLHIALSLVAIVLIGLRVGKTYRPLLASALILIAVFYPRPVAKPLIWHG